MDWKPEYSLGIQEIDDQHQRLLRHFTSIEEAFRDERSWADRHFVIVDLVEFVRFHFEFEEAIMRMFGFAHFDEHRREHASFFTMVEDIERCSLHRSAEERMVGLLRHWLTDHILGSDRGYADLVLSGAPVRRSLPAAA